MSSVLENIKTRRSVRKYKPDPVPRELIEQVLEAGTYAATGRGQQSPVIVAVTNKDLREKITKLNAEIFGRPGFDTFYGAPVILIVAANKANTTAIYDGALVLGNMMLEAHELGLGSCWIHRCKEAMDSELYKDLFKKLGIVGDYEGVGHLALGYADGPQPKCAPRKEHWSYFVE